MNNEDLVFKFNKYTDVEEQEENRGKSLDQRSDNGLTVEEKEWAGG
jgi:ribosomal 30S subunit maturation factor RimM